MGLTEPEAPLEDGSVTGGGTGLGKVFTNGIFGLPCDMFGAKVCGADCEGGAKMTAVLGDSDEAAKFNDEAVGSGGDKTGSLVPLGCRKSVSARTGAVDVCAEAMACWIMVANGPLRASATEAINCGDGTSLAAVATDSSDELVIRRGELVAATEEST